MKYKTFNVELINQINQGLYDDCLEPVAWLKHIHAVNDHVMGRDEVRRHILEALSTSGQGEFDQAYVMAGGKL